MEKDPLDHMGILWITGMTVKKATLIQVVLHALRDPKIATSLFVKPLPNGRTRNVL